MSEAGARNDNESFRRPNKRPRRHHHQAHNDWQSRRGRPRRSSLAKAPPPPPKPKCCICQVQDPKYKCPQCRLPYCTVACCKSHKEGCTGKKESENEKDANKVKSKYLPSDQLLRDPNEHALTRRRQLDKEVDDDDSDELEEGWKLTRDMIDQINQSEWLRKELQDGGLRQLIYTIDSASKNVTSNGTFKTHQEEELADLQQKYPSFRGFINKLLVSAGVLERQGEGDDEDLESWLQREPNDLGPLALKPLPRRGDGERKDLSVDKEEADDEDSSSDSSSSEESSSNDDDESSDEDSSSYSS